MRSFLLIFLYSQVALGQAAFDLRDKGQVSLSKKQSWGTCWAFATVASIESNLLVENAWKQSGLPDLSEYHMDKYSGFSRNGHDDYVQEGSYSSQGSGFVGSNTDTPEEGLLVHVGGDYRMATAYLSNIGGAVEEYKTPGIGFSHDFHDRFGNLPDEGVRLENSYEYYLPGSVQWLSYEDEAQNILRIKESIRSSGSVASSQFMQNEPHEVLLTGEEVHFYFGNEEPTHAVNLIGWDDEKAIVPMLPGVWIVQDSDHMDEVSGHIGYLLTPYWDTHTGQHKEFGAVSFRGTRKRKFKKIHSHSLHGWQYEFRANKISNVFKLEDEVPLYVGTYTVVPNDRIVVFVSDLKGNMLCHSEKAEKENPGFYLTRIRCQEDAFKDGTYRVEVQTESNLYAHDGEKIYKPLLGKSMMPEFGAPLKVGSKAHKGESFYFKDGEWKDLFDYRWRDEVQFGKTINKSQTSNFSVNLYTKKR